MNQKFLTQLPITYADSVCLENSDSNFNLKISNNEHQLVILLKNILTFNFSKDSLNSDDDYIDIIEIVHEYRKVTHHDLKKYSFSSENVDELPPLNIVTFYGNTVIEVICKDIEIKKIM